MNLLEKVGDFLSGGLGSAIVNGVKDYFPPSMSEQEKADLEYRIKEQADKQANEAAKIANEATQQFNKRIAELEGSAADLKTIPVLGHLIIFARGCQRPVWGFSTLYMDFCVFSGTWADLSETQESALWVINLLVLGFLFGERAVKNLAPLIERVVKAKVGSTNV